MLNIEYRFKLVYLWSPSSSNGVSITSTCPFSRMITEFRVAVSLWAVMNSVSSVIEEKPISFVHETPPNSTLLLTFSMFVQRRAALTIPSATGRIPQHHTRIPWMRTRSRLRQVRSRRRLLLLLTTITPIASLFLLLLLLLPRHNANLTPIRVRIEMRHQLRTDVHQTAVVVLLKQRRRKRIGTVRQTAGGPIGAAQLCQMGDVAGHQERRIDDGFVDLHVQIDEGDVFLR